jgi:hypothetical protein
MLGNLKKSGAGERAGLKHQGLGIFLGVKK